MGQLQTSCGEIPMLTTGTQDMHTRITTIILETQQAAQMAAGGRPMTAGGAGPMGAMTMPMAGMPMPMGTAQSQVGAELGKEVSNVL